MFRLRLPHRTQSPTALALAFLAMLFLTGGCADRGDADQPRQPVEITRDDQCYLCGMIIADFPGPKGEAYTQGKGKALKFCSTVDLFTYLLQPEAEAVVREAYVHDMAATEWPSPAADAFIDARAAWYVAGHPLRGAMGPTLASFKRQEDAQAFRERFGGRVLRFDEITLDLILGLSDMHAEHDHAH